LQRLGPGGPASAGRRIRAASAQNWLSGVMDHLFLASPETLQALRDALDHAVRYASIDNRAGG